MGNNAQPTNLSSRVGWVHNDRPAYLGAAAIGVVIGTLTGAATGASPGASTKSRKSWHGLDPLVMVKTVHLCKCPHGRTSYLVSKLLDSAPHQSLPRPAGSSDLQDAQFSPQDTI